MAREELAEFCVLCMLSDGNGNVLVQDRNDPGWPGVCFPGGHVEEHEPIVDAVFREMKEETGLTIKHPQLCGVKEWINEDGSRYVVFLFRADTKARILLRSKLMVVTFFRSHR